MKQIIIADSTQLDCFDTCPSQWLYSFHESIELSEIDEDNSKKAIRMGTLGHKWLELYYSRRALGASVGDAVKHADTLRIELDNLDADPKDNHQYPLDTLQKKIVFDRLQHYWMTYSQSDYIPLCRQENGFSFNEDGTVEDIKIKNPIVEQGFSYELLNTPEYLFILEGRIDMIAPLGQSGQNAFIDHKFQLRERKLYSKSIQFKNYALATGLTHGVINYIRLHQTISNKTLERKVLSFNPAEIRAWRSELIDMYVEMAKCLKGVSPFSFPKRRSACGGKFGYPCPYNSICDEPNYLVGIAMKEQRYIKKEVWKPW